MSMRRAISAMLVAAAVLVAALVVTSPAPSGRPVTPEAPNGGNANDNGGGNGNQGVSGDRMVIAEAVAHDVSQPLRKISPSITKGERGERDEEEDGENGEVVADRDQLLDPAKPRGKDAAVQGAGVVNTTAVSAPGQSFDGLTNLNGVLPPDTTGDVGPNHYVQWVNLSMAVYSKTGALLWGPSNGNAIWSGFGGVCSTRNDGDPIVQYDQAADRWMIAQFSVPGGASGYHECIAVSQTGDPTGAWYRYDFLYSSTLMNDYPHFGVWPDGYYMTVNQFKNGLSWAGQGVAVFERDRMLAGQTARMVMLDLNTVDPKLGGMLPADWDGTTAPPAGAPNPFAIFDDDAWAYSPDQVQVWNFHVDWTNTAASTFTKSVALPVASFDSDMCAYARNCIAQSGTTTKVDALSDRLMYRLQYRNFGDHQALVMNHTVDVTGTDRAGIRWYELRNTGTGWSVYQQSTYSPDATNRWVGSIAMNGKGGIGLGYSASSASMYPAIRYTGRVATDPLNTMAQGEGTIVNGTGAQTHTAGRWGDYSTLSVDPVDDCTFWYTGEYVKTTGSAPWVTRIGSFQLPDCVSTPPTTGNIAGKVIDSITSAAVSGATVTLNSSTTATTDASGNYSFSALAPDTTYTITVSKTGYTSQTSGALTVTAGSTTTANISLVALPITNLGPLNPTTYAAVTTAGDKNGYEGTPANLLAIDGLWATDANSGSQNNTSCTSAARDAEILSGYGVPVPAGSTVKGITVKLTAKASTTTGSPKICVLLSPDNGITWTAAQTTATLGTATAGLSYTLGSTTNTWGRTWTSGQLANGSFLVRVVDIASSTKVTFSLDGVTVQVTYQ